MRTLRKVLLVVDLSPGWEAAVRTAIGLVERLGTEVVPIHVIPSSIESVLDTDELRKAIDARLREIVRAVSTEDRSLFTDTVIAVGAPFDEVVRRADDEHASAIVIGAGVTAEDAPVRIGPLAARVMRHSRKPVWVVEPGSPPRVKSILCPVDTSPSSDRALRNAIRLSAGLGAQLTVLHVIKSLSSQHPVVAQMKERGVWDREYVDRRRHELDEFLCDFDFGDASWRSEIREGNPRDEIIEVAQAGGHDLIVMGTVGRKGLTRLLVGSVTESVTQAMPCSVVTLRDESLIYARIGEDIDDSWKLHHKGRELLDDGFAGEAAEAFERAIAINRFHVPALEGLAEAQDALGRDDQARRSRHLARKITEKLRRQMVDLERPHPRENRST